MRDVFARSFETGEVGAALAVTIAGRRVIDLWGGHRDAARTQPWTRDTLVNVYSTTKGMTAICANRLVEQGLLDLDAPVARYWPEFAAAGKQQMPVRWLLCHQAGVPALREDVPPSKRFDWKFWTEALAAEAPWWEPGTQHGYHALSFGHLVGEVVRRVDGRSLGRYFREELARAARARLPHRPGRRAATRAWPRSSLLRRLRPGAPNPFAAARKNPHSLVGRVFGNPTIETGDVEHTRVAGRRAPRRERPRHGARPRARLRRARLRRRAGRRAGALARADRAREHRAGARASTRCSRRCTRASGSASC